MTAILTQLLGRLPVGWLQLTHNRTRMAAALAGVAFANVLVFVQLGILGALGATIATTYEPLRADIILAPSDASTLTDGSHVARRFLYQALAVPGVTAAAPLYLAKLDWTRPDGSTASMQVYGLPPEAAAFASSTIAQRFPLLRVQDTALIDTRTRGVSPDELASVSPGAPLRFEANGLSLSAISTLSMGGGFTADGNLIVSDQTFLRLFGGRVAGAPSRILVATAPGADPAAVVEAIRGGLHAAPITVATREQAIAADKAYQGTQRPTGVIFGFGVFIGVLVGIVIVYQVLATDVADHLREYATLKAMGYRQRYFLGVVFEEAVVLGVLGFVPGLALASLIYAAMTQATGLPVAMDAGRAAAVFLGTIGACAMSGAIATRRLAGADPADLF
ncbi:MAG: ABC transporter permease DevC [Salinarimonas sp.]